MKYCQNCGKELADENRFCENCGTPCAQTVEPQTPPPVEPEAPKAKKKGKAKPVIITIAVIVAVLGILGGLLVGFRDTIREWGGPFPYIAETVDKLFLSDKEYAEKKVTEAIKGGIDNIKNKVDEVASGNNTSGRTQIDPQNFGATAKTKIEFDKELLNLLKDATGTDLSFLHNVELAVDVDSASNGVKLGVAANLNDTEIVRGQVIADLENEDKTIYMSVPTLSDDAVYVTITKEQIAELTAQMADLESQMSAID